MYNGKQIISGYVDGRKFRPSNWPERLCEAGATLCPTKRVMRYSPHLHIKQCQEHGYCVYVDFDALDADVAAYVTGFVDQHRLTLVALSPTPTSLESPTDYPYAVAA